MTKVPFAGFRPDVTAVPADVVSKAESIIESITDSEFESWPTVTRSQLFPGQVVILTVKGRDNYISDLVCIVEADKDGLIADYVPRYKGDIRGSRYTAWSALANTHFFAL